MAAYSAELKTVLKWEKELKCSFTKEIRNGKVISLKCDLCVEYQYASRLKSLRSFTPIWVTGSTSVKRDSVKKHLYGEAHLMAADLNMKKKLGTSAYNEKIVKTTLIGQGLAKMAEDDKETMRVCFNTVFYLAKQEHPFSDYPALLFLQQKNGVKKFDCYKNDRAAGNFCDAIGKMLKYALVKGLVDAKYYSLLTDGSTDAGVFEQKLIYVLFLNRAGRAEVRFYGVEGPANGNAIGLKDAVEFAFNRVGVTDFTRSLFGLNVDGASVNTGIHGGLGALLRQSAEWLTVVHCFNRRLELAAKDAFKGTFFDEVDTMLIKLFYLYQKSPKRLRELREFSEIFEKTVPKPAKAGGTRWIGHKISALNVVLQSYGAFITHLESLAKTDSQDIKRAEIAGFVKKWQYAKFPLYIAMYLDVLLPLKVLSVGMQKEEHDPVLILRRLRDFNWTMVKLKLLVENSLQGFTVSPLTNYSNFLKNVCDDDSGNKLYQNIELKEFDSNCKSLKENYEDMIIKLSACVEGRFTDLNVSPVFKNMLTILDISIWPTDENSSNDLITYGDRAMEEHVVYLKSLLEKNGCNVENIPAQWDVLKS